MTTKLTKQAYVQVRIRVRDRSGRGLKTRLYDQVWLRVSRRVRGQVWVRTWNRFWEDTNR